MKTSRELFCTLQDSVEGCSAILKIRDIKLRETTAALTTGLKTALLAAHELDDRAAGVKPCALTKRELDVARLVCEGCCDKEAASLLRISPHTVKKHRENIYRKLGVNCTARLVRKMIQLGLVQLTPA